MKLRNLIFLLASLSLLHTVDAQILKKLKKKAEAAAERTLLKKTDEVVTKKTAQAVDTLTISKKQNKATKDSLKSNDQSILIDKSIGTNNKLADLHLQASVQPLTSNIGGTVNFTIAVNNKGPATSDNILSKIHIPSSYRVSNISVTQGSYNKDSKLWEVGSLEPWKRSVMTVVAIVIDENDLMVTGEIMACSTQDPDSTPGNGIDTNGNGNIIDDREDEDDGDGQIVIIGQGVAGNTSSSDPMPSDPKSPKSDTPQNQDNPNENGGNLPDYAHEFYTDVKMEMWDGKDKIISYLDFDTMAMRMEYHSKGKNPDPVYWDQFGYIYSADKGKYIKMHFKSFANAMVGMAKAFAPQMALPFNVPDIYNEVIRTIYNNKDVMIPIDTYPMIEWAFYYHPSWFEGVEGIAKETISCRGSSDCKRYIVMSGESTGCYVVFDSEDFLIEISNPDGAKAIYTYEQATVNLPPAQTINYGSQRN